MRKGRLVALRSDTRTLARSQSNGHDWPAVDPGDYGEPVVPLMGRASAPPLTLAIGPALASTSHASAPPLALSNGPAHASASRDLAVIAPSAPPILRLTAPEAPAPPQLTAPPARDAAPLLLEAAAPKAGPVVARSRFTLADEDCSQLALVEPQQEPEQVPRLAQHAHHAAGVDASTMVPLVRAKKLAPWLLPPHMAELAAAPNVATTEPAKLQLMCCGTVACRFPWATAAAVALLAAGVVLFTLHVTPARRSTEAILAAVGTLITGRAAHWLDIMKIASVATTAAVSAAGAAAVLLAATRLWQRTRRAEGAQTRGCSGLRVMTATVVAAAYVLCMWLVALLFATGMWLTFVIVLQSGSGATMQGNNGVVAAGTCPGEACLNLSAFSFIGGGGCLCDGAALAAVLHEATHARRELVYTLIGETLMFLGCTLMMAALAASAAMTTALRARMENDHDAETPNKPGEDTSSDAQLPVIATPGTVRDDDRALGLPSPERAYLVDEGPPGSIKSYRPADASARGRRHPVSHTPEEATLAVVVNGDLSAAGSIDRRASDESAASSWETLRDRFLGVKLALQAGASESRASALAGRENTGEDRRGQSGRTQAFEPAV